MVWGALDQHWHFLNASNNPLSNLATPQLDNSI